MNNYIAFLRGINVGGNTLLPMKDLSALCAKAGFEDVSTYINSGNMLFKSLLSEEKSQEILEKALLKKMGTEIKVVIRDIKDIKKMLDNNPFPKADPAQVGVLLTSNKINKKLLAEFITLGKEKIILNKKEAYIHYPDGMGKSKLKFPVSLRNGTVRNINTLTRLAELV